MPTTPRGLPYPAATAAPNVPADLQALAEAVEVMFAVELGTADLNTYQTPGVWAQSTTAEATLASNYPVALPGLLEVFRNAYSTLVWQRYTTAPTAAATGHNVYVRGYAGSGWTAWRAIYTDTGWLNVAGSAVTGTARYRRLSGVVFVQVDGNATTVSGTPFTIAAAGAIPAGFRPSVVQVRGSGYFNGYAGNMSVGTDGSINAVQTTGANRTTVAGILSYPADA